MGLGPLTVSYTRLNTQRDCPLKHTLHYLQGWRPVERDKKLQLGSAWHEQVLENHYRTIRDYQEHTETRRSPARGTDEEKSLLSLCSDVVDSAIKAAENNGEYTGLDPEDYATLQWMYDGYKAHWGCDPQWRILDVEYMGLAPLGTIQTVNGPQEVLLDYRIDLVVEDSVKGGIFAVESKSAKTLTTQFAMELDDQTGLYEWAFRTSDHPQAKKINGCVRSEAKKSMNVGDKPGATKGKAQSLAQRHQRLMVPRGERELDAIARDALGVTQAAYGGNTAVYSSPNPAECQWKCQFKEVHILLRKGLPLDRTMRDFGFRQVPTEYNGISR
jgi:hypothetical protein